MGSHLSVCNLSLPLPPPDPHFRMARHLTFSCDYCPCMWTSSSSVSPGRSSHLLRIGVGSGCWAVTWLPTSSLTQVCGPQRFPALPTPSPILLTSLICCCLLFHSLCLCGFVSFLFTVILVGFYEGE